MKQSTIAAGVALVVTLILLGTTAHSVHAQNSCPDPFAGTNVRFDPGFWQVTDFCQRSVDLDEFLSGGPPPDGIPPIDNPQFEDISDAAGWLAPQSPVVSVVIAGEARAYPLAILTWHEIANDVIADVPVAVTFCPLCNSALVFDRTVGEDVLRFGVSGNLRNSDLIMWDDKTQSWWQQFTGEALVGAYTGTFLTIVPSQVVGFGDFGIAFPDGRVLSRETGQRRSYGSNPYVGYDSSDRPFLFDGTIDPRLPAIERVLAGLIAGEAVAYPFEVLAQERVINDVVGDRPVVAIWQPGATSALDRRTIDESRDVGMAALFRRVLADRRELTFSVDDAGVLRDDQTGSVWNVFGLATDGDLAGEQLQLERAAPHFWFAWAAFRPDARLYTTAG